VVLALGKLDRCLDVVHRDEWAATVEGRRDETPRWGGRAIALMREAKAKKAVHLVAQRSAPFRAPTHQLSCDVWIEDDGGTHA